MCHTEGEQMLARRYFRLERNDLAIHVRTLRRRRLIGAQTRIVCSR